MLGADEVIVSIFAADRHDFYSPTMRGRKRQGAPVIRIDIDVVYHRA